MERTGLVMKGDKGYKDMYVNRIMFPLYDLTGRVVGYSGRIYNSENYKVFECMLFYSTTSLTLSSISHSLSSTDIPFNNYTYTH